MEEQLREFLGLSGEEVASLLPHVEQRVFAAGETIFALGDISASVFIVLEGTAALMVHGQTIAQLTAPNFVGGVGLLDNTPRRSSCVALSATRLASISRQAIVEQRVPPALSLKLLFHIGGTVNNLLSGETIYSSMDVLLVQDGGCSPGYNSVTAYLVEEFEKRGAKESICWLFSYVCR